MSCPKLLLSKLRLKKKSRIKNKILQEKSTANMGAHMDVLLLFLLFLLLLLLLLLILFDAGGMTPKKCFHKKK